jgi:hypothetical protein
MEPPASPRKPKRPKDTPDKPEGETPAKPRSSKPTTPPKPSATAKPAPKPRSQKTEDASPPRSDATPMVKPGMGVPPAPPASKKPPEAEEHISAPSTVEIPGLSQPRPAAPAQPAKPRPVPSSAKPAGEAGLGDRLVKLSRTVALRNMEVGRKYGRQAADATRGWVNKASNRLSRGVSQAQSGKGGTMDDVRQRTSKVTRQISENLDRGFNYTQRRLEVSDSAVIAFTLALVLACIVLTALAVYAWNRF